MIIAFESEAAMPINKYFASNAQTKKNNLNNCLARWEIGATEEEKPYFVITLIRWIQ